VRKMESIDLKQGIFRLPQEIKPDDPTKAPETIKVDTTRQRSPRSVERSIVVKDGMRFEKIVQFPYPDRYIPLGKVEEAPKIEVKEEISQAQAPTPFLKEDRLRCPICGYNAKNQGALNLHKAGKHRRQA